MPFKQKLGVMSIFLLGILVVITSSTLRPIPLSLFTPLPLQKPNPKLTTIPQHSNPRNLRLAKQANDNLHSLNDRNGNRHNRQLTPRPPDSFFWVEVPQRDILQQQQPSIRALPLQWSRETGTPE